MKKLVKRILLAVGALLLLVIIAVGIVLAVVDPNDYRDEIATAVYDATGRKVDLAGPLSLKVFPRLGISAQDVKLASAQGTEPALLSLHELSLRMAILPLLTGSVQIDTVVLDGLVLNLVTDKDGRNNWDVPASADAAPAATPVQSKPAEEEAPLTPAEAEKRLKGILNSRISQIIITNCTVSYINQPANQDYFLNLKELSLNDVGVNRDITCKLNVEAEDRKAAMQAAFTLEGWVRYMLQEQSIAFDLSKVTLGGAVPQIEGRQQIDASFKGNMNLADMAGAVEAAIKHNHASANLSATFGLKPVIKADGKLALTGKPADLMRMLKIEGAPKGASPLDSFNATAGFAMNDKLINVNGLEVKLGNGDLNLRAPELKATLDDTGKSPYPVSTANLRLEADAVPAAFIKMVSPDMALGQGTLQKLALNTNVDLKGSVITITPFNVDLDNKTLVLSVPKLTVVPDTTGKSAIPVNTVQGSLSLTGNPVPYIQLAGIQPTSTQGISKLDAGLKVDLNGSNLKISDFKVLLDKDLLAFNIPSVTSKLNLNKDAMFPISTLSASASLKAKPRTLMDIFGVTVETADPNVLRDFSANLALNVGNGEFKLSNLKANLDTTTLTGSANALLPGAKALPKGSLASLTSNLQLGVLNLDKYLPPDKPGTEDKKEEAAPAEQSPAAKGPAAKGPLQDSPLAKVYADVTLGMQKLTIKKADVEKINLRVLMDKGVVTLNKGQLNAFNGSLNATASAALAQPRPDVSVNLDLQKLNLGKVLVAFADENRLDGTLASSVNVKFSGLDTDSILKTLNGKGKLALANGAVQNISLIPSGIGGDLGKYSQNRYEFRDVDASFTFIDGKLVNDHVNASGLLTRVEGVGSIILATGELDYKGTIYGKNGEEIPFLAGGPINHLWLKLDTEEAAKIAARKAAEKAKEELQKKGVVPTDAKIAEKKQEAKENIDNKIAEQKEKVEEKVNTGIQRSLEKLLKK